MLDYRVETFLTLYDEMNYRKTAQRLNMTQPGVTQHIHYLEKYYGTKLFEYDGRKLLRTKSAELLKKHFDSMKVEESAMKDSIVDSEDIYIRVGATKTIGEFVISQLIIDYLKIPKHHLELIVDNTENLLHQLEYARLDFAMIEGIFDKTKYEYHLFKKEKFVGICSNTHPFAGQTVPLESIFKEDLVVREIGSGTRRLLENTVKDKGYDLTCFKRCSSVSNFSVICDLVANNHMITFAYEPIAHSRNDLAVFYIEDLFVYGEFNFVYCNKNIANEKVEKFLKQ